MKSYARYAAQAALHAAFLAVIAAFSAGPRYHHLDPGEALIRLTLSHAAQRKQPCRQRTPEELAKLPPNMRAPLECPRERAVLAVELELNGQSLVSLVAPPSGIARDGPSVVYRRIVVPAGRHELRARLSDNAAGRFDFVAERTSELAAGRALTIDFNAATGGFLFTR